MSAMFLLLVIKVQPGRRNHYQGCFCAYFF